ncbi:MAG: TetR/AcrR family transcriptional regulator [Actinomycetota bacterium]
MPRLWTDTVETHRHEMRDAIQDATIALVTEQGLLSVTMSRIAEETGIGRATLYKYFPDVESILWAWHERHITAHLRYLTEVRDRVTDPGDRVGALLEAFAQISHDSHGHPDTELVALLHTDEQVAGAERQVRDLMRASIAQAADAGAVRDDVSPIELATYCVHALAAAHRLPSKAAVRRLVEVTLAGLQPPG